MFSCISSVKKLVLNHVPKITGKLWKNVAWIWVVIYIFYLLKVPSCIYTISKKLSIMQ